jgi:hypothetical protein
VTEVSYLKRKPQHFNEILFVSQVTSELDETKVSSGMSQVTRGDELIDLLQ